MAVTGLAPGCHAVMRIPIAEPDAVQRCAERSVAVEGMSRFRSDRALDPAELVLGFGNVRDAALAAAIRRIGPGLVR